MIIKAKEDAINDEKVISKKYKKITPKYLKLLDFYKSTIDGDFGKGTRAAISNWQISIDKDGTGYLTKKQIKLLKAITEVI